jgi:hypothetical protein
MDQTPTMKRLEEEIAWYDSRAMRNHLLYKGSKVIVIGAAALIPFMSGLPGAQSWHVGALGVLIAVLEGLQQLNQYHANWTSFRATCESLKREKYLFLAAAGPYAGVSNPGALLAERIEALISQEAAKWVTTQEKGDQPREDQRLPKQERASSSDRTSA